jgi:D-alanyl-D-alanine carboxypeptidase (penicillin-binding protein 5/6)
MWTVAKIARLIRYWKSGFLRYMYIYLLILSLIFTVFSESFIITGEEKNPVKNQNLNLYSLSCALIDGDTGRVLYGKNENDIRAMASTTKVMTLILALEEGNPDDEILVSSYASSMPEVKLGMKAGERYKLRDLLYSLILESHNDTAVAIAEGIAGSVEDFADMMNEKAKSLGLDSTYFITPNGLDAEDENGIHSTTAVDLARLTKYAVYDSPESELFNEIAATRSYSFTELTTGRSFTVGNKNAFLDMMEGVVAGKTGFTADAGYCYTAAMSVGGRNFVIALLGCGWPNNKTYKWTDAKKLFEYGMENYEYQEIDLSGYTVSADVKNGVNDESESLEFSGSEAISLLLSDTDELDIEPELAGILEAPVDSDFSYGTLTVTVNNYLIGTFPLYPEKSVERYDYNYCLQYLMGYIFGE